MPDEIRGKWTKQNNKWINKYIDEAKEIITKTLIRKIHYLVFSLRVF